MIRRARRGGRSGSHVFVVFIAAQALAMTGAALLHLWWKAVQFDHPWTQVLAETLASPLLAAFIIMFGTSIPMLTTSLAAGTAWRALGRVPLMLVPLLAVAWGVLALWQVSMVPRFFDDREDARAIHDLAWAAGRLALLALLPLTAAWWWTTEGRAATPAGSAGVARPSAPGQVAAPPSGSP
ncbi:hypothetical protein ACI6QG_08230 [Roseococcus sp. DSY-14]|uniref:hypothetical protein n=1 Tax=Roseococcus sp. DSY-14 TaxID=3369650 RepID=UPI00387B1EDC